MHIKLTNGTPTAYSIGQLRRDNPQTSFPKIPTDALLAEWDVYPLVPVTQPQADHTKNVVEGVPILQNGVWTQVWGVSDASSEEVAQRTAEHSEGIRRERNEKLSATDWRFRSDMNPSQEWKDYCQALRDVTEQAGFPFTITWPTEPN